MATSLDPRRLVRPFYVAQAIAVAAWWLALSVRQDWRAPFVARDVAWDAFAGFALPDLLLLTCGSLVAAWWPIAGVRLLLLGATLYPSLLCLAWTYAPGGGEAAALAMLLMSVANAAACAELRLFRPARAASPAAHVATTLAQVAPFWTTFLLVLPRLIARCDPWRRDAPSATTATAIGVFVAASLLGLASGVTMARRGLGTPLPTASPTRLVASGPYAWVRNPMAVAGVLQGLAVAALLGSPLVAAYAIAGAMAWHAIARPAEEADLAARFGAEFGAYRARVPLWVPRPPRPPRGG